MGSHPLVRRFCKGASIIKPPKPRYDFVWDPAPVIAKLAETFPYNNNLSLKNITKKLALLLALGSGQRAQTLAAIRIPQISFSDDKLVIRISDRIKTSAPGRTQPLLVFSRFRNRPELCIFSLLKYYLCRTKSLRPDNCDSLFIAYVKPHKAIGVQTMSRWLRMSLGECGVRGDLFSAHSTRHASTSLAARKGVPVDLIKRAAGWTGDSRVFARFYNRPILDPAEFSDSVLLS